MGLFDGNLIGKEWGFKWDFASILAEIRVLFWRLVVTWLGSALGSGWGSGSAFGFTDEKSVRRGFGCSCSAFRAAASALQGGLICILGPGLGSLRPTDRLSYRCGRPGIGVVVGWLCCRWAPSSGSSFGPSALTQLSC